MSYCRFSEADVYVYASTSGGVVCCGCATFYDAAELVAHLREHLAAGHDVPEYLLDPDHYDPDDFTAGPR